MATPKLTIPRGLKKRGRTWHISRVFNGRLVRLSTGCSDLESAIRVYRRIESGELSQPQTDWWSQQVDSARAGRKSVFSTMLAAAKSRASLKNLPFSLNMPKMLALAAESGGYCAVSSVQFSGERLGARRPLMPSLDRIDSSGGYELHNCRLVCVVVNYAISDFGEGPLRIVARAIVRKELEEMSRTDRL